MIQVAAFDAGRVAYNEARPSRDVPFLSSDPDVGDLRTLWIRGWVLARTDQLYGNVEVPPADPKLTAMKRWRIARAP